MTSWPDTTVGARNGCGTHLLLIRLILIGWAFALAQMLTIDTPGSLAEAGAGMQIFAFINAYVFCNPFAFESVLSFSASATGAWGVTDALKSAAIWPGMTLAMMLPVLLPLNRTASRNPPRPSATFERARFPRQEFLSCGDWQNVTRGFFSNLLFENEMRDQVMQRHAISAGDIVGLLYHLGTDCPGSISCVPEGDGPVKRPGVLSEDYDPIDGSPQISNTLSDVEGPLVVSGELARFMKSLRDNRRLPDGSKDPSPLAGVQGKIALTRIQDGRLALSKKGSGAPTTHILKVPRASQLQSVRNEHIATQLMARIQKHETARTPPEAN